MRLVPLMLLIACAGSDAKTETGDADPEDAPASFAQVRDEVLVPSCGFGSCHGSAAAGLQIDADMTTDALVNVPSTALDGAVLVIPGDTDGSYLMAKLLQTDGIDGDVMPPSGAMTTERIAVVSDWIAAGAQ